MQQQLLQPAALAAVPLSDDSSSFPGWRGGADQQLDPLTYTARNLHKNYKT